MSTQEGNDHGVGPKEMYDQGSKTCQQYSALTMQIRSQAVYLLLTFIGAMGVAAKGGTEPGKLPDYYGALLLAGGLILVAAAFALCVLNEHHSTAHNAIRDKSLVALEGSASGPWTVHSELRTMQGRSRSLAWKGPFYLIGLVGLASAIVGGVLVWAA